MALFISHLYSQNFAPATIISTVSAVAYMHKINNCADPTSAFVIKKILHGANKLGTVPDKRLPITKDILIRLYNSVNHICTSHYSRLLFRSMYVIAFFAFLRVGEFTGSSPNVLLFDQIILNSNNFSIVFKNFKHHKGNPITMIIQPSTFPCPVKTLKEYLVLRGSFPGPLFCYPQSKAITRECFSHHLNLSLTWAGLSDQHYKSHSFRIGAATHAAALGYSDAQIQAMGRWKSSAFRKYIRLPTVTM